jgi:hypothetical protein
LALVADSAAASPAFLADLEPLADAALLAETLDLDASEEMLESRDEADLEAIEEADEADLEADEADLDATDDALEALAGATLDAEDPDLLAALAAD